MNDVSLVSIQSSCRDQDNFKITTDQIWSCSFMLQEKVLKARTTLFCGYCISTSSQESKGSELYYLVLGFLSCRSGWTKHKCDRSLYIAVNSTNLWIPICLPLASGCCRVSAPGSLAGIANTREILSVHHIIT